MTRSKLWVNSWGACALGLASFARAKSGGDEPKGSTHGVGDTDDGREFTIDYSFDDGLLSSVDVGWSGGSATLLTHRCDASVTQVLTQDSTTTVFDVSYNYGCAADPVLATSCPKTCAP